MKLMKRLHSVYRAVLFAGTCALLVSGCHDSSSSGSVSALSLPDRIEISQADDEEVAESTPSLSPQNYSGSAVIAQAYSSSGTDYSNATCQTWVDDTDCLSMVNGILGVLKDTRYENFVNEGAYKAMVRGVGESEQSQGGNSTTSSTTEDLQEIIVEVTRASSSAPMIAKVWVEEPDGPGGNTMRIRGYFTVTEGVSDDYPYGAMVADFKGTVIDSSGAEGDVIFTMAMSVDANVDGDVVVQFVESGNEEQFSWSNKAHVVVSPDMTEGVAYANEYENSSWAGESESTFYFAFNEGYFKEQENGTTTSYDKDDYYHKVYRYKLFDSTTGDAITMNSGFPIQFENGENGYIGYYGLWTPQGVSAADLDTITNVATGETYTLALVRGKLTKHTRDSITLGDLTNVEMSKYECSEGSCVDYVVTWDGSQFKKIGYRNQQTGQVTYYEEGSQTEVTFSSHEGAWCEPLRSYLRLGTISEPSDSSTVYYHSEQTINPGSISDMTLYYWGYALDAPITQSVINNADESSYWENPSEQEFTFDSTTLILKDAGLDVIIGASINLTGTNYTDGYCMGPLTTTTKADMGEAYNSETYYNWQTGPNEWNQFAGAIDASGDFVDFTAPLHFTYTHSTGNDLNGESTYNGKKFHLEYDGFELHVPWEFDEEENEWRPVFNLKNGTELTADSTTYVVKGVSKGLVMEEVDSGLASGLVVDTSIPEPSLTYDSSNTDLVGALPTGTEVKVIKGELVE